MVSNYCLLWLHRSDILVITAILEYRAYLREFPDTGTTPCQFHRAPWEAPGAFGTCTWYTRVMGGSRDTTEIKHFGQINLDNIFADTLVSVSIYDTPSFVSEQTPDPSFIISRYFLFCQKSDSYIQNYTVNNYQATKPNHLARIQSRTNSVFCRICITLELFCSDTENGPPLLPRWVPDMNLITANCCDLCSASSNCSKYNLLPFGFNRKLFRNDKPN